MRHACSCIYIYMYVHVHALSKVKTLSVVRLRINTHTYICITSSAMCSCICACRGSRVVGRMGDSCNMHCMSSDVLRILAIHNKRCSNSPCHSFHRSVSPPTYNFLRVQLPHADPARSSCEIRYSHCYMYTYVYV
jgi:hypothetical protein